MGTPSNASVELTSSGRCGQIATGKDGLNLVVFRNASSGSAIATTTWWSSGGRIIGADIVFWDAAFRFFSGSSGCSGGFYIEDLAAHEFGHALGLDHSNITGRRCIHPCRPAMPAIAPSRRMTSRACASSTRRRRSFPPASRTSGSSRASRRRSPGSTLALEGRLDVSFVTEHSS